MMIRAAFIIDSQGKDILDLFNNIKNKMNYNT